MKTRPVDEPQPPRNKRNKRASGERPKRGDTSGPLGFGSVMRDVRGGAPGGGGATPGRGAAACTMIGSAGFDPALAIAVQLDAGAAAARSMGATLTTAQVANEQSFGVRSAEEALAAEDRSPTHRAQVQILGHVPSPIVRTTPAALLDQVLDESTKLAIDDASRELHVELEPVHLGPLIVRLKRGPGGALDIKFLAREGEAQRVLEAGSDSLRSRLAEAGFAAVAIDVSHDPRLQLTGETLR